MANKTTRGDADNLIWDIKQKSCLPSKIEQTIGETLSPIRISRKSGKKLLLKWQWKTCKKYQFVTRAKLSIIYTWCLMYINQQFVFLLLWRLQLFLVKLF